MRQNVIFHPLARLELQEAIRYYEGQAPGLGLRLSEESKTFLDKILANPLRYAIRVANVRRANLKHFPYSLNYFLHGDSIVIVAIAHHRQRPFYWRGRLRDQDWLGQE